MWSVIGHNRAISLLQKSLETGSLAHAYLLVGPTHVGKMTLALDLAKALNCAEPGAPCGECPTCSKIARGKHADVRVIGLSSAGDDPETRPRSEISIEQIRDIQYSVSIPAFEGKCKVFIIEDAEYLSTEAANCLLKTLEEPADKVVFILLAANQNRLPETVISRCQRLELLPAARDEVVAALTGRWGADPEKAALLAHLSRGRLGWAVNASDDTILNQRTEQLDELTGLIDGDGEGRFAYAARLAALFGRDSAAARLRLDLWLDWWRDLLLVKIGLKDDVTNADRLAGLVATAGKYSLYQIKNYIESIRETFRQLSQNANPQLALEVLVLSIPEQSGNIGKRPVYSG